MSWGLALHLFSGTLAIIVGGVTLGSAKGSWLHRAVGRAFAVTMLITAATGAYLALNISQPKTFLLGLLTFYLAATGWRSARQKDAEHSWLDGALAMMPIVLGALAVAGIVSHGRAGTISLRTSVSYTILAAICFAGDMLNRIAPGRTNRLARHLWRMCFALLIAEKSLFLGQPQVFPEMLRKPYILSAPLILTLVAMLYWLFRVLVFAHMPAQIASATPSKSGRARA